MLNGRSGRALTNFFDLFSQEVQGLSVFEKRQALDELESQLAKQVEEVKGNLALSTDEQAQEVAYGVGAENPFIMRNPV